MNKIFSIILNKKCILILFLSNNLVGIFSSFLTGRASVIEYMSHVQLLVLKLVAFTIYLLLAYLSIRDFKVATWVIATLILLSGVGSALIGMFKIGWHQYLLKPYFVILGFYYIFGGVSLIYTSATNVKKVLTTAATGRQKACRP